MKNKIKIERAKKDMTQAELAQLVQVTRQTINAIEAAKYNLSTALALKIASIFETKVVEIFELEEKDWLELIIFPFLLLVCHFGTIHSRIPYINWGFEILRSLVLTKYGRP